MAGKGKQPRSPKAALDLPVGTPGGTVRTRARLQAQAQATAEAAAAAAAAGSAGKGGRRGQKRYLSAQGKAASKAAEPPLKQARYNLRSGGSRESADVEEEEGGWRLKVMVRRRSS